MDRACFAKNEILHEEDLHASRLRFRSASGIRTFQRPLVRITRLTILIAFFAYLGMQMSIAQTVQVTGTVISSEDKQPVVGAIIRIKGTTAGVLTDANGKYSIEVPSSSQTLEISFLGYKTIEVVTAGRTVVDIALESEAIKMEEVVVTALGIPREKKALGYAVQDVNASDISAAQQPDVINALNGRVAGVQITNSAGVVGGSTYMTIRGVNSITGETQPLFVVDGVPIDNSMMYSGDPDQGQNNLVNGSAYANRVSDINPDDIESVSILKGGAATALYGIQAANGVVMITTKKGSKTKDNTYTVNFSSTVELTQVSQLPPKQNLYAQGQHGSYIGPDGNGGEGTQYSWGPPIDSLRFDGNTSYPFDPNGRLVSVLTNPNGKKATAYNNYNSFFVTGTSYTNSISLSGGNENSNFFASYSNLMSSGVVPLNYYNKNTFKVSGETKLSKFFKIFGSEMYINNNGNNPQQGSNLSGVMLGLLRCPATFDISFGKSDPANRPTAYTLPGSYNDPFFVSGAPQPRNYIFEYDNPLWSVNNNKTITNVDRIIGSYGFNYTPLDWLTVNYRFGNDVYIDRRLGYFAINSYGGDDPPLGEVFNDNHFSSILNSDFTLNFKKDLTPDLKGNLLLGQNMYELYQQQIYMEGDGLSVPGFYQINNTSSQFVRENEVEKRTAAIYADLSLSYKEFLFLDVTARNEWSTTLPTANNSFFFPSVSLGFIFTEIKGLKNDVLTLGKIRASYAETALDAPEYYTKPVYTLNTYEDGWTNGIAFPFTNSIGSGVNSFQTSQVIANNLLKPEFTNNFEVGADLSFYNKFTLNVTYFNNSNNNQIIPVPIAGSSGFIQDNLNIGKMTNTGLEVTANFIPVKTHDWNWNFTINFTQIVNKVVTLAPNVNDITLNGFTGITIEAVAGKPFGEIFATDFVRDPQGRVVVDNNPADNTYGQPIASSTQVPLGSYLPNWIGTFSNSLSWKGISLDFLLEYKNGGKMWNGTQGRLYGYGIAKQTEDRGTSIIYPGVEGTVNSNGTLVTSGQPNTIPMVKNEFFYTTVGGGADPVQSQFVQKTDWIRLRTITLGYTFNPKMISGSKVFRTLSIFATGKNLFLRTPYTGIDPETSLTGATSSQGLDYFNMPGTKSYAFGLKLGF